MCGINGIFTFERQEDHSSALQAMCGAMAHRGPDNEGTYHNGSVHLGHRRLSIIDLSEGGNQPLVAPDGLQAVIYNGELYNYRELKQELSADYEFKTESDTEVVLAAYRKWGFGCLDRFNGMFGFAIWDDRVQKLLIARDRIGIKPVYFYRSETHFVFASEVRSLLASGLVPRRLEGSSLVDYLRYQTVHAPNTILKDVYMLRAGHFLMVDQNGVEERAWWKMEERAQPGLEGESRETLQAGIKERFYQSVERRMIADVPFGAFLSGGIDSSAVVGAMSQVASKQVRTFSVVFNEEEFSEARYARLIAKRFNTDHTEIKLTPADFLELLPQALKAMDHPSGDGPNTFVVSKVTREAGITMALSGLGGDELFAGYDIFKRSLKLENRKWLGAYPKFMRRFGGNLLRKVKPGMSSEKISELLVLDYYDLWDTYPLSRQVLLDRTVYELLNRTKLTKNRVWEIGETAIAGRQNMLPLLSRVSVLEAGTYMQNVLLRDTDQMSMAHALEVRVPFLDHELVEYVLGIPDSVKFPNTPKQLLTDSLGDLLPREIIDRPKMGFILPWEQWLKGDLRSFCEEKLNRLGQREWSSAKEIDRLWKAFNAGSPVVSWSRIWLLVVLENWLESHGIE